MLPDLNSEELCCYLVHGLEQYGVALTPREWEVILCVFQGMSPGTIAVELKITLSTVRAHLKNIHGKIGTSNTIDLVSLAYRNSVIYGK